MGLGILTWLKIGAFAALAIAVGLFVWHYQALNDERDQLLLDVAAEKRSVEQLKKQRAEDAQTVDKWKKSAEDRLKEVQRLSDSQKEARDYARKLERFFGSTDLRREARDRRDALELRLNSGTVDALRLWECHTGRGASCAPPATAGTPGPSPSPTR